MQLSKAVDGYLISALADGYSPLTLRVYKSALFTMIEYLGDKDLSQITTLDLREFMNYLQDGYTAERFYSRIEKNPELSKASHHRYWKAMRSFFKWADRDLGCGRPDLPIKMPKAENKAITPLTEEEVTKLLKVAEFADVPAGKRQAYKFRKHNGYRNRAIILVLLATGLRVGELTRLRVGEVNLENGEVHVRPHFVGKTRSRTTFLGRVAKKAVWRYLVTREDIRPDDPLFVTIDGRPMTRERILAMLKRLGEVAGVKGVHPHRFRHTFAIQYLRNGGDVFTLKDQLGHANMTMVDRYLNIAKSDTETAHRKANPVDNWKL